MKRLPLLLLLLTAHHPFSDFQQPASVSDLIPVDLLRVLLTQRQEGPQMNDVPATASRTDLLLTRPADHLGVVSINDG